MAKGRKAKEVNKNVFVKCVNDVEKKGPLVNRQALYNAVADLYNKQNGITDAITFSVAYLRIKEWDVPVVTSLGKREINTDALEAARQARKLNPRSRADKTSKFKENYDLMREEVTRHDRANLLPLVDKIEKGSVSARIRLNCLRCVGYENKEVAKCTSYACPWFAVRPNALTREEQAGNNFAEDEDV